LGTPEDALCLWGGEPRPPPARRDMGRYGGRCGEIWGEIPLLGRRTPWSIARLASSSAARCAPTKRNTRRSKRNPSCLRVEHRGEVRAADREGRDAEGEERRLEIWGEMGRDGERWGEMGRDGEVVKVGTPRARSGASSDASETCPAHTTTVSTASTCLHEKRNQCAAALTTTLRGVYARA